MITTSVATASPGRPAPADPPPAQDSDAGPASPTAAARFAGFGPGTLAFYAGLVADNSKAYWNAHRHVYEHDVRAPLEALLAELQPEFGDAKVFRPYRDVRFSADKAPYKTHAAAWCPTRSVYLQVGADGLLIGGGRPGLGAEQLPRYRAAVSDSDSGRQLQRRLAALQNAGYVLAGRQLKTRPRGVPADHPRLELLRHTSLYVTHRWAPDPALHQTGLPPPRRPGVAADAPTHRLARAPRRPRRAGPLTQHPRGAAPAAGPPAAAYSTGPCARIPSLALTVCALALAGTFAAMFLLPLPSRVIRGRVREGRCDSSRPVPAGLTRG